MALNIASGEGLGGDEWDRIPDDELEETIGERLWGLREMFPEKLRYGVGTTMGFTFWAARTLFNFSREAVWILASSVTITLLPFVIERERAAYEKSQVAQQRQMLLGPTAAVSAAKQ